MTPETGNRGGAASGSGAAGDAMDGAVVRVILYDADTASEGKLREVLENITGVRVVECLSDVKDLVPSIEKSHLG